MNEYTNITISPIIHPPATVLANDNVWLEWRIVSADDLDHGINPDQDINGNYQVSVTITSPNGETEAVTPTQALTPITGHFIYQWAAPDDPGGVYEFEFKCIYQGKEEIIDRRLVILSYYSHP